jgi:hypothetical protein
MNGKLCLIHLDARDCEGIAERKSCTLLHAMRCCRLSSRGQVFLSREEEDVSRHEVLQEVGRGKK